MNGTSIGLSIHILIEFALIVRVLLRPHREPASRIAWIVVIAALPIVGILAYILFGEVNIGRRRIAPGESVASLTEALQSRTRYMVPDTTQAGGSTNSRTQCWE